jgi:hypothetical protein
MTPILDWRRATSDAREREAGGERMLHALRGLRQLIFVHLLSVSRPVVQSSIIRDVIDNEATARSVGMYANEVQQRATRLNA